MATETANTSTFAETTIRKALYKDEGAGTHQALVKRFNAYVGDATNHFFKDENRLLFTDTSTNVEAKWKDGSERILASKMDEAIENKGVKVFDGGNGTDIIDFDSYYINSVRDIEINKTGDYFEIKVLDYKGIKHTYKVKNIEGFRFVDKNGTLHKYKIYNDPTAIKTDPNYADYGAFVVNRTDTRKVLDTTNNNDYIKITTAGTEYASKGGDDTIEYAVKSGKEPTIIYGGEGNDTLLLSDLTKDDIKQVRVDSKGMQHITLKDDRVIIIKDIETIKLKNWAGSFKELQAVMSTTGPDKNYNSNNSTSYSPSNPAAYDSSFFKDTSTINYIDGNDLMGGDDPVRLGGGMAKGTNEKTDIVVLKGCRSDYVFETDQEGRIRVSRPDNSTRKYMYLKDVDVVQFTQSGQEKYGINYHDNSQKQYAISLNGTITGSNPLKDAKGNKVDVPVIALFGVEKKQVQKLNPDASSSSGLYVYQTITEWVTPDSLSVTGTNQNDFFRGYHGNDTFKGEAGDDVYVMSGGNDTIEDTSGNDLLVVLGRKEDYEIKKNADGTITVKHKKQNSFGWFDTTTMKGIERIQFSDGLFETKNL